MERYIKMEVALKETIPDTFVLGIFPKIMDGQIEIVPLKEGATAWAKTPDAEDMLIDVIRSGNYLGCERFPKRWAETTDLDIEGIMSLDGTKKLVTVTCDSVSDYPDIFRKIPEEYVVTSEFLKSLSYTDLKNFIRRYPELDDELNLSSSQSKLLEETISYFDLLEAL